MRFLTSLIKRSHFWRIAGLLAADAVVFGAIDPNQALSIMLVVGFLLLSATAYCLLDGFLAFTRLYGLPLRHRKRVLRALTLLISGLLALQSIGQLSLRDVMILGPLTVLAYFYVAYSKSSGQRASARA